VAPHQETLSPRWLPHGAASGDTGPTPLTPPVKPAPKCVPLNGPDYQPFRRVQPYSRGPSLPIRVERPPVNALAAATPSRLFCPDLTTTWAENLLLTFRGRTSGDVPSI